MTQDPDILTGYTQDTRRPLIYGYLVMLEGNRPMGLATCFPDCPQEGVLCYSDLATIFATEALATVAIHRTRTYAGSQGFDWNPHARPYLVLPVSKILP